jgi:anti-anti-sigma factor
MTIRSTMTEDSAVVKMAGTMAAVDFTNLHGHLLGLLQKRRRRIVLDFGDVEHVDFKDASSLAREFELVRSYNGYMKVAGLSPYVRDILVFAGLSDFLDANTPGSSALDPARTPQAS